MNSLVFERNLARFAAARIASTLGSGRGAGIGPLRLVEREAPRLPGVGWHHVKPVLSGICGSDLATLDGRSSRYFEDVVSFPFVPGHEVLGTVGPDAIDAKGKQLKDGARVVLEPVLGCLARGIEPPCAPCATGATGNCEQIAFGHLRPGLQTGFCTDTGGGWSSAGLVAHHSQLHAVPDSLSDLDAVTVEPVACALHAVLGAGIHDGDVVAILGAGTLGLAVTASITFLVKHGLMSAPSALLVGAKYAHQQRTAAEFGATDTLPPDQLSRAIRRQSRSLALGSPRVGGQRLTGGADIVIDCVGSSESIEQSLCMVRPRGRVVLVGMPARVHLDLASLWHREVSLTGAYAYGLEHFEGKKPRQERTFDLALSLAGEMNTGRLVSATYPLERFEEAVGHAGSAGKRGAVKVAFDLRLHPPTHSDSTKKGTRQ